MTVNGSVSKFFFLSSILTHFQINESYIGTYVHKPTYTCRQELKEEKRSDKPGCVETREKRLLMPKYNDAFTPEM